MSLNEYKYFKAMAEAKGFNSLTELFADHTRLQKEVEKLKGDDREITLIVWSDIFISEPYRNMYNVSSIEVADNIVARFQDDPNYRGAKLISTTRIKDY